MTETDEMRIEEIRNDQLSESANVFRNKMASTQPEQKSMISINPDLENHYFGAKVLNIRSTLGQQLYQQSLLDVNQNRSLTRTSVKQKENTSELEESFKQEPTPEKDLDDYLTEDFSREQT